jgi:magnesium transporter
MKRRTRRHFQPPGAVPGTAAGPVATGAPLTLSLVTFGADAYDERLLARLDEAPSEGAAGRRGWLRVVGHDPALLGQLAERYGIHPLVVEDILDVGQRPKAEDYSTYLFVIVDTVRRDAEGYREEQVSLLLFENLLISVQERESDLFRPIEDRLRAGRGRARSLGLDHLAYSLIDTVVDHYFPVLEQLNDRLEEVEDSLLDAARPDDLQLLHAVKRDLMRMRKATWPLREMVASLGRGDSHLMGPDTRIYMRDVHDHTVQIMEMIDACRDMATSLTDLYISSLSNRLNGIMKVLTVIATFFMPLSFLASLWGMNFNTSASRLNMPELNWVFGYPFALSVMAAAALAMFVAFKRRGWF